MVQTTTYHELQNKDQIFICWSDSSDPTLPSYFLLLAFVHLTLSLNSWALILFFLSPSSHLCHYPSFCPPSIPHLPPLPNLLLPVQSSVSAAAFFLNSSDLC